jgi:glucokinase
MTDLKLGFPVLIGDIGGTNARFSVIADPKLPATRFEPVRIDAFCDIEEAIQAAVLDRTSDRPASMMLAIATPLVGERFRLTNGNWVVDPARLLDRFGLETVVLLNDFSAQGLAALALGGEDLAPIGEPVPVDGQPKVVIGPGTGLGIAILVSIGGRWAIIPGEGGHVDLGPRTSREMAIWPHLDKLNGRLSAEMALSGRGLENLYRGICRLEGVGPALADAAAISRAGMAGNDAAAGEAIRLFLTLLARVAGDMALVSLARGGIYIAGGIGAKLLPAIRPELFRAEFENKAPHEAIMAEIAICVMTHPLAALEGLAALAAEPGRYSLEQSALIFTS